MSTRRRKQQRGVLLSFAGISVGFLICLSFRLAGFWQFELSMAWLWLLITAGMHAGLWLVLKVGWPWYQARDPHFLYLPWACVILLFSLFVYLVPEARVLIPFGYLVNLLFLVGLAGFREVVLFSLLMATGYFGAVVFAAPRGEQISLAYEAMMAGLLLTLGVFAGTVLERARNQNRRHRLAAEQLRKLSLAVDQSPSLLVITDTAGRIEYVNPKFSRTTGYSLDEILGLTPRILRSEETPPEVYEELWETISAGEAWQGELKNLKKNGEPYWVIASISPLRDGAGNTTHYLAVQEDITERRRIEQRLALAQKMESVGQLVSGVAHDFNNLLTGVLGFSELALSKVESDSLVAKDLLEIKRAGESASTLTQQLLAFGRRQMLQPEILDLNEILLSTEELLRRTIQEHIDLEFDLSPDLGLVRVDPAQIQQILLNLAVNARDAMPDGGHLKVATRNAELESQVTNEQFVVLPGSYVELAISDTGRGMDSETRQRVFEPFFTTKERGRGTGLGLATTYGIVKQSRGYIWAESEPGCGTTFTVVFPRETETPKEEAETVEKASRAVGANGSGTVLLVEDDNVVRTLAESILKARGYRVLAAENAAAAIERWEDEAIDLLISDIVMPGMNGIELAGYLGSRRPDLKVLLLSGYAEGTIIDERLLAADTPFVGKPFKVGDFVDKVGEVMSG